jgi:hypothetical protein
MLSSLIPHYGISWQAHACGALGGVVAAWLLSGDRAGPSGRAGPNARPPGLGSGGRSGRSEPSGSSARALAK